MRTWMVATFSCLVLRLSWGCDNCATSRHFYLSTKYMFLWTFSKPENMLADKKKTFFMCGHEGAAENKNAVIF